MSAVKIGISLNELVYKIAKEKADLLFGGNLSGYITYLISIDNLDKLKKEHHE